MNVQVVSFKCVLKNKAGQWISTTINRDVMTAPDERQNQLLGLSKALQNIKKGEKRNVNLPAEEAYGLYDPRKVVLFPKKKLPKTVSVGEQISIAGKSGQIRTYRVLQLHEDMVSLDGNHPLAGQDLIFEIEALEARDASPAEIAESTNASPMDLLH